MNVRNARHVEQFHRLYDIWGVCAVIYGQNIFLLIGDMKLVELLLPDVGFYGRIRPQYLVGYS
jgi:hypothetical protein